MLYQYVLSLHLDLRHDKHARGGTTINLKPYITLKRESIYLNPNNTVYTLVIREIVPVRILEIPNLLNVLPGHALVRRVGFLEGGCAKGQGFYTSMLTVVTTDSAAWCAGSK